MCKSEKFIVQQIKTLKIFNSKAIHYAIKYNIQIMRHNDPYSRRLSFLPSYSYFESISNLIVCFFFELYRGEKGRRFATFIWFAVAVLIYFKKHFACYRMT